MTFVESIQIVGKALSSVRVNLDLPYTLNMAQFRQSASYFLSQAVN